MDGSNVIGTVPEGWWRDRRAAAGRLLARLQCLHARTANELIVVRDVFDPELSEGEHSGVAVRTATRRGPNAADDRIRELVAGRVDDRLEVPRPFGHAAEESHFRSVVRNGVARLNGAVQCAATEVVRVNR